MAKASLPIVTVKGAGNDNKVVLWERDEAHPGGEIFVSNDGKERKVALTKKVKTRLREGHLIEVGSSTSTSTATATPTKAKKGKGKDEDKDDDPAGEAPWVGYDELTVDEVLAELETADDATKETVLAYETANSNRKGIIDKVS